MTREEALAGVKGYLTYGGVEEIVAALDPEPCEYEELDFVQPHKKIPVNLVLSKEEQATCKNCINAKECVMYEPNMKRCGKYTTENEE